MTFIIELLSLVIILYLLFKNYVLSKFIEENELLMEEETTIQEDWTFPINLEYNSSEWYAWDRDGTFIGQAKSKDILVTEILNRFDMAPKRLVIKSEKQIKQE